MPSPFHTTSRLLLARRPSALLALEQKDVTLLSLQPFSPATQRAGEHAEARRLAALSPVLARVPMLPFILRELITSAEAAVVMTRTELYGRYLDYTVYKRFGSAPSGVQ
jgi:hypothetical protein